jgi:hypothetical protein
VIIHEIVLAVLAAAAVMAVLGITFYGILRLFKIKSAAFSLFLGYCAVVIYFAIELRDATGLGTIGWIYPFYLGYPASLLMDTLIKSAGTVFAFYASWEKLPGPLLLIIFGGLQWYFIGLALDALVLVKKGLSDKPGRTLNIVLAAFTLFALISAAALHSRAKSIEKFRTMTRVITAGSTFKTDIFYSSPRLGAVTHMLHYSEGGKECFAFTGTNGMEIVGAAGKPQKQVLFQYPKGYYDWEKTAAFYLKGAGKDEPSFIVGAPESASPIAFFNIDGSLFWKHDIKCSPCILSAMDAGGMNGSDKIEPVCLLGTEQGSGIVMPDYRQKKFRLLYENLLLTGLRMADIDGDKKAEIITSPYSNEAGFCLFRGMALQKTIKPDYNNYIRCFAVTNWFDSERTDKILYLDSSKYLRLMDMAGKQLWEYLPEKEPRYVNGAIIRNAAGKKYYACLMDSGYNIYPSRLLVMDEQKNIAYEMQIEGNSPSILACGDYMLFGAGGKVYKLKFK